MTTHMTIDTSYKLYASYKPTIGDKGIVLVFESRGWQDYMVEVWVDGKHLVEQDYFTTDKVEAVQHARAMVLYMDSIILGEALKTL